MKALYIIFILLFSFPFFEELSALEKPEPVDTKVKVNSKDK